MKISNSSVLNVALGDRSYDIHLVPGGLKAAGALIKKTCPVARRLLVISNKRVFNLYGSSLTESLRAAGFLVEPFLIGDGERFKSLQTAEKVLSFLIEAGFERSDAIVGFGGGVVGDLAGFVAALYLRGVDYIQIPTTLLAQIDSSVGGKTAVNHKLGKNLIGAFYQPRLVIIDPETLKTLPAREMTAGLCEAIKYGVIRDRWLFHMIEAEIGRLKTFDLNVLVPMIRRCCEIKAEVVSKDERESGLRMILNFGHTVGHALEAVTSYRRFKHGEAVGYGMIAASRIALKMNGFSPIEADRIASLIHATGRLPNVSNIDPDETFRAMSRDKKMSGGKLSFILPDSIGVVVIRRDVSPRIITETIKKMIAAG